MEYRLITQTILSRLPLRKGYHGKQFTIDTVVFSIEWAILEGKKKLDSESVRWFDSR